MSDSSIVLSDAVPKGMEPLRVQVIHPDNIALEQRIKRARLLSQTNVLSLKLERWRLKGKNAQFERMNEEYQRLRALLPTAAGLERNRLAMQLRTIQKQAEPLLPARRRWLALNQLLNEVAIARARLQKERELNLDMAAEARIYAKYIRLTWQDLPECHHRYIDKKGKTVTEVPGFAWVDITPDAIYFKLLGSFKAYFGWKTGLPYGVYLQSLVDERTLQNIALACQRQVTAEVNNHGAWIIIHRLNSTDGLMDRVDYRDVMAIYPESQKKEYAVCVGVGAQRQTQWVGFVSWPHWLIAGWTGGGKSNIVNVIISTLITKHTPAELRLVLIDLKGGVEFDFYRGIPHLIGDIIEDVSHISGLLEQLEAEMARRFKVIRSRRKKTIEDYNAYAKQHNESAVEPYNQFLEKHGDGTKKPLKPWEVLARIIIFFDEFASIANQGDTTKRIKASLQQIVAKGRAVGINVVASTQTPNVDTIPGVIKTNLSVRIVGRMPTASSSVTALGSGAASELAAIPGRMVLMIDDEKPIQTPLIQDEDIRAAIDTAKANPPPPPLELPEGLKHQEWTPQRLAEFSLTHLGGNISGVPLYNAIQDEDISRKQVFDLVEQIMHMKEIIYEGKRYQVKKGKGWNKTLVEVKEAGVQ